MPSFSPAPQLRKGPPWFPATWSPMASAGGRCPPVLFTWAENTKHSPPSAPTHGAGEAGGSSTHAPPGWTSPRRPWPPTGPLRGSWAPASQCPSSRPAQSWGDRDKVGPEGRGPGCQTGSPTCQLRLGPAGQPPRGPAALGCGRLPLLSCLPPPRPPPGGGPGPGPGVTGSVAGPPRLRKTDFRRLRTGRSLKQAPCWQSGC